MLGDGVSCAVCGGLVTVMVSGVISIICNACGEVSFSGASRRTVGCAVGVDLEGGGRLEKAVGWRGHSPAEGAGCLLLSALFLKTGCVGRFLLKVSSTRTWSFPSAILQRRWPTNLYSLQALSSTVGITDWFIVILFLFQQTMFTLRRSKVENPGVGGGGNFFISICKVNSV